MPDPQNNQLNMVPAADMKADHIEAHKIGLVKAEKILLAERSRLKGVLKSLPSSTADTVLPSTAQLPGSGTREKESATPEFGTFEGYMSALAQSEAEAKGSDIEDENEILRRALKPPPTPTGTEPLNFKDTKKKEEYDEIKLPNSDTIAIEDWEPTEIPAAANDTQKTA
ncbi:hypothetical protein JXD20_01325 [Candidatus Peregrinibacteria bacterium]|nr:hypothetical protein [Candidatus Peregrinibacteria bacterium]